MYNEIVHIQKLIWKDDDRMEQEVLFELQEYVADLALKIAMKEGKADRLVKEFPWLYS